MIRFKEKEFEQWSICPATGDIFDVETGEIQSVKIFRGRPVFKNMAVHRIMAHTFFGWKPGFDVHHKDKNKLNNVLSNLMYLTHSEHVRLHSTKLLSDETRLKISESLKGMTAWNKGRHLSEETCLKIAAARKGKHHSEETKAKIGAVWKGRHHSEEARLKIAESQKGKHLSEEARLKIAESQKGRKWWNNGKITMFSNECPGEGWIRGRRILNG